MEKSFYGYLDWQIQFFDCPFFPAATSEEKITSNLEIECRAYEIKIEKSFLIISTMRSSEISSSKLKGVT